LKQKRRNLFALLLIVSFWSNSVAYAGNMREAAVIFIASDVADESITISTDGKMEISWDPTMEIIIPTQEEMDEYHNEQALQRVRKDNALEIFTPDYIDERYPVILSDLQVKWADGTVLQMRTTSPTCCLMKPIGSRKREPLTKHCSAKRPIYSRKRTLKAVRCPVTTLE